MSVVQSTSKTQLFYSSQYISCGKNRLMHFKKKYQVGMDGVLSLEKMHQSIRTVYVIVVKRVSKDLKL